MRSIPPPEPGSTESGSVRSAHHPFPDGLLQLRLHTALGSRASIDRSGDVCASGSSEPDRQPPRNLPSRLSRSAAAPDSPEGRELGLSRFSMRQRTPGRGFILVPTRPNAGTRSLLEPAVTRRTAECTRKTGKARRAEAGALIFLLPLTQSGKMGTLSSSALPAARLATKL